MFALVADVEAYPEFLPLCRALRVLRRSDNEEGGQTIVADMEVGYKAIRETFTSRVTCDPQRIVIRVEYIDGPFRRLQNLWTFKPEGEGACLIGFDIDYEFKSRALQLLVGGMFDAAFRRFAEAFEKRADLVYGKKRQIR